MLTRKEERIERMLNEEKTWDTIMKELNVAPHTIKKVKEAITRSAAFEMFERECTLFEVSWKLDISSEEVKKYHLEYLELKGEDELVRLLKNKDSSNLVSISREIKARDLTLEQLENALKLSSSVRQFEGKLRELSACIRLERDKYEKLCEEKSTTVQQVDNLNKQKVRLLEEMGIFESKLKVYQLALEKILNSKEITNLQEIVQNIAKSILDDKKILLGVAAGAIIHTIATNPQSMTFFSNPAAMQTVASLLLYPGPPGNEMELFRLANSTFETNVNFIVKGILGGTINTLGDSKYESETERLRAEFGQLMTLQKHNSFLSSMFEN